MVKKFFTEEEVVVINGGPKTSSDFATLPFDHLLFTGSTNVARKVSEAAASNLVPLTLELGGKSPVIVGPNAKLKKSVDKIMMGKLVNAGQICIAPDYIFVPQISFLFSYLLMSCILIDSFEKERFETCGDPRIFL